jgi:hypothetical protein
MTREEKQLLLKDLCGRLPYGIKVEVCIKDKEAKSIDCVKYDTVGTYIRLLNEEKFSVKPYLRPMSSMTEEEKDHYDSITYTEDETHFKGVWCKSVVDWLNKKMFDYRGLIEMGLALEAPEGMYNN